jgi:hypothetical protein
MEDRWMKRPMLIATLSLLTAACATAVNHLDVPPGRRTSERYVRFGVYRSR